MREFVLIVNFDVRQGDVELLLDAGRFESIAALRDEQGCRAFDVLIDSANSHKGCFYEVYDDEAAYKKHRQTPHYFAFFTAIESLDIEWDKSCYWRLVADSSAFGG